MNLDSKAISAGGAIAVIGGWLWITNYFVTQENFDVAISGLNSQIKIVYYEVKMDTANMELSYMDGRDDLTDEEKRKKGLLEYQVQRMTVKLEELRE